MNRVLVVVLLLVLLGAEGQAHNGEYKPPLPPPMGGPSGPPGIPTPPTWRRKPQPVPTPPERRGPTEVTPPDRPAAPGEVAPETPDQPGSERSLRRLDDRFRWDLWWEMDRPRFLEPAPLLEGAARRVALEALRALLADSEPLVRGRALVVLGRMRDESARAAALSAIEEKGPILDAAVLTLGLLGGEGSRTALREIVSDRHASIVARAMALVSLGLAGDPASLPLLREVVDEESEPNLRSAAVVALGLLRDEESVARLRLLLVARAPGSGPGDLDPLDDLVRSAAAFALGRIGTPAARGALLHALEEGDGLAAGSAALAIGALGDPAALAALREAVASNRPLPARALAIVALARRGDPGLREILRTVIADETLRRTNLLGVAILAMALVGGPADVPALAAVLKDDEVPPAERAAAAAALGCLRSREAITPLTASLGGARDPLLRAHVVLALARLGAPAAAKAVDENLELGRTTELRRLTMNAIGALGGETAASRLIEALGEDYFVHRMAARELTRADPARGLAAVLLRCESDVEPMARRFAADALGWMLTRDEPAMDVLRGLDLLSAMPLLQALAYHSGEEFLYDLTMGL